MQEKNKRNGHSNGTVAAVAVVSALAALAGAWMYNKNAEKAGTEPEEEEKTEYQDVLAKDASEECSICFVNAKAAAFVPCGHECVCISCAEQCEQCPVCRNSLSGETKFIKIFR